MESSHTFQASYLHAITRQLFEAADTPRHIADDVAEVLVGANLAGHDSHGVQLVPMYLTKGVGSNFVPAAEPRVIEETRNRLVIDGGNGFGHHTARRGMALALEKVKQSEMCVVSYVNTGHIARLGEYAEQAARAGAVGTITTGSGGQGGGWAVPYGGIVKMLGTNPIAVGIPTGDDVPFILDFATSVVAEGKVKVAHSWGHDVQEGTIIDKNSRPTVKTADFYDNGALLSMGGHKGYALALLTCLLGGLAGGFDTETKRMGSSFMQVLDIEAFTPLEEYERNVRAFLDGMKSVPAADGFEEVLVPGDFEYRSRRERSVSGIPVPDSIFSQLREWASKLDVSLSEDGIEAADAARYKTTEQQEG